MNALKVDNITYTLSEVAAVLDAPKGWVLRKHAERELPCQRSRTKGPVVALIDLEAWRAAWRAESGQREVRS